MRRVIVAGGRDFDDRLLLGTAMSTLYTDWYHPKYPGYGNVELTVLTGMARGADSLIVDWCVVNWVPWEEYPADWETHGKKAGALRNIAMADKAYELVAFWDGESRGTKHMIDTALAKGLTVHVFRYGASNGRNNSSGGTTGQPGGVPCT